MLTFKEFLEESKVAQLMDRTRFEQHLSRNGWSFLRAGSRHDVWSHPAYPHEKIEVPRHKEISSGVVRKELKTVDRANEYVSSQKSVELKNTQNVSIQARPVDQIRKRHG